MMKKKWIIGVHFHEGLESSRRMLNGITRYIKQNPELKLRDYNFVNDYDTAGVPPWKGRVDGIVGAMARINGIMEWLHRGDAPIVNASGDLCDERTLGSVFTDTHSLVSAAAKHFLELGRKQIGFIGSLYTDLSHQRKQVFTELLVSHKIKVQDYDTYANLNEFHDFASLQIAEPKLIQLLKNIKKPCAILCLNDHYAVSIAKVVEHLGFSVPEDIAILGTGDLEIARLAAIPISSIRTDIEQIGYESIQLLHSRLRSGRFPKRTIRVPILELVPRQSTVCERQTGIMDMERALQFIANRAAEKTRVEDVANYMQMPLRTFELEFAKSLGYSVGQEIRMARLKRAQELLKTTQLSLRSVAKMVGLTDAANMNRYFLRWSKQSASDYRKTANKKRS
jgi:LacI family transcriptional regulator